MAGVDIDTVLRSAVKGIPPELMARAAPVLDDYKLVDERLRCEASLYEFIKAAWPSIDGSEFLENWAVRAYCEHLEAVTYGDIKRLLCNFPPRCQKTITTSVCWPAWVWAQSEISYLSGPQVRFLCGSYGERLSLDNSNLCRRLIMSPWYQRLWGHRFSLRDDQNTKGQFDNTKNGSRIATSVGGSLLGLGGDIVIIDDPHNTEEVESEDVLAKATRWYNEIHTTRLNSPTESAVVAVMQRLRANDISGVILDSDEEWCHFVVPMVFNESNLRRCVTVALPQYDTDELWQDNREDGDVMWPERFPPKKIEELRSQGDWLWSGRYQQNPVPPGGGIIKREFWQPWDNVEAQKYGLEWTSARREFPDIELVVASLDTAYGEKEENDYNALTVWGIWIERVSMKAPTLENPDAVVIKELNRRAMLMFAWAKRVPLHGREVFAYQDESKADYEARKKDGWGLVEWIADTCKHYKVRQLLIEDKTRGRDVANELRRLYARDNWGVELIAPTKDKVTRVHSIVPMFTNNAVWAPDTKWSDEVITQCLVGDTMIVTDRGVLAIKDIQVGDRVLTHLGRFRPVVRTFRRTANDLMKIEGKSLDQLCITFEHPVRAVKLTSLREQDGEIGWVMPSEIVARAYRDVVRNGKMCSEAYPSPCHALILPVVGRESPVDEIDLREWASTKTMKDYELISDDEVMTSSHWAVQSMKWRQPLDRRFGRIVGLFLAEGSARRYTVAWSFNANETEFIKEVSSFIQDRLGCRVWLSPSSTGTCITVCSSLPLAENFFLDFGKYAYGKYIAPWVWDAPDEFIEGIIDGYMDGDGCKTNGGWSAHTVSFSLAWGMRLLCLRLGRKANVFLQKEAGESVFNGRVHKTRRSYTVSFLDSPMNEGAAKTVDGGFAYSVMRLSRCDGEVDVFNLEVAEDNSYCTTGGLVHNCSLFPKAEHDDYVDTISMFMIWAREKELLVRSDEMSAAMEEEATWKPHWETVAETYGV